MKKKYIRYARTTEKRQPNIANDINWQLKDVTDYAHKHGMKIINTFTDFESATSKKRRGFQEMLRYIQNGTANGILCIRLDRLSRDFETSFLLYKLIQKGLEIVTPGQVYNKNTSDALMAAGLTSHHYDKTYSEYLSKAIKRGLREKKLMRGGE